MPPAGCIAYLLREQKAGVNFFYSSYCAKNRAEIEVSTQGYKWRSLSYTYQLHPSLRQRCIKTLPRFRLLKIDSPHCGNLEDVIHRKPSGS